MQPELPARAGGQNLLLDPRTALPEEGSESSTQQSPGIEAESGVGAKRRRATAVS